MIDKDARRHPFLFHRRQIGLGDAALLAFLNEGGKRRIIARGVGRQRVFGGHGDKSDAHDRICARGEHPQLFRLAIQHVREGKTHALALADPVLLHQLDLFRPAGQLVQIGQQLFGVGGNLHVIHGNFALLDERAGAPAAAIDDLLVGQHGLIDRVPIHRAIALVDQPLLEQAGKQPLLPAVVVRLAGCQLAIPVEREAQTVELPFHVIDIGIRPLRGRHVVLNGGIFRRHAKSVPAHRLQDVVAEHFVEAREHIADRVIAHVPHVQLARRVGEHRQTIIFRLAGIFDRARCAGFLPQLLGGQFDVLRLIFFLHGLNR